MCYHRNAYARYPSPWLAAYSQSIENQTEKADLFELDYGDAEGASRLLYRSELLATPLPTHVHAQNHMLDMLFGLGYDAVLNTNVDDVYYPEYVAVTRRTISDGADVSSSNFALTDERGYVYRRHAFDDLDVAAELRRGNNIISHPTVAFTRRFWEGCSRYDPSQIPEEDMRLWAREVERFRFVIAPEILVNHRIHDGSVCAEFHKVSW